MILVRATNESIYVWAYVHVLSVFNLIHMKYVKRQWMEACNGTAGAKRKREPSVLHQTMTTWSITEQKYYSISYLLGTIVVKSLIRQCECRRKMNQTITYVFSPFSSPFIKCADIHKDTANSCMTDCVELSENGYDVYFSRYLMHDVFSKLHKVQLK